MTNDSNMQGLELAEQMCAERHMRLTKLRREVLGFLLGAGRPVKAYELLDRFREQGKRVTPTTVYRVLNFLLASGLVHKISCINAYMPCTCKHHGTSLVFFVCSECQKVQEIEDEPLHNSMRQRFSALGIEFEHTAIEMRGTCPQCTQKAQSKLP